MLCFSGLKEETQSKEDEVSVHLYISQSLWGSGTTEMYMFWLAHKWNIKFSILVFLFYYPYSISPLFYIILEELESTSGAPGLASFPFGLLQIYISTFSPSYEPPLSRYTVPTLKSLLSPPNSCFSFYLPSGGLCLLKSKREWESRNWTNGKMAKLDGKRKNCKGLQIYEDKITL